MRATTHANRKNGTVAAVGIINSRVLNVGEQSAIILNARIDVADSQFNMTNIIPTFIERAIRVDNEYVVGIGATVTSDGCGIKIIPLQIFRFIVNHFNSGFNELVGIQAHRDGRIFFAGAGDFSKVWENLFAQTIIFYPLENFMNLIDIVPAGIDAERYRWNHIFDINQILSNNVVSAATIS